MKKVVLSIIIALIIVVTSLNIYANGEIVEFSMTGADSIREDTKKYVVKLNLGSFTNVEEGKTMGFEGKLQFDSSIFESVTVKGLNDWTITYSSNTNKIIGETDNAVVNKEIAEITFNIKENVAAKEKVEIVLKDAIITDADFEVNISRTLSFDIVSKTSNKPNNNNEQNVEQEENINQVQNQTQNQNSLSNNLTNSSSNKTTFNANSNNVNSKNIDNTISNKSIPKAGIANFLIILIVILIIVTVIFKIKSRKIKY